MTGRRSNGEGSIYRTKDGRWRASVDLGWKDGKRQRKYLSAATKADVARKVREALKNVDDGMPVTRDGRGLTVRAWLEHWLETVQKERVRFSTLQLQRGLVRHHVFPTIGHIRLRELTVEDVERMSAAVAAKGLSAQTRLHVYRTLSRALKVAHQRGKVGQNVCALIDAPAVTREEVEPLSLADARRVVEVAAARRNGARWSVALSLGMRQAEALGMAWDHVDLDKGTIAVRQQLNRTVWNHGCSGPGAAVCGKRPRDCPQRHGQDRGLSEPKSRAGKRVVVMPPPLIEAMRAHRVAQLEERIAAGSRWWRSAQPAPKGMSWDLVFRTVDGRPLQPTGDYKDWLRLLEEAGVRRARLHDARHTAASLLLAMRVAPRVVMEVLGHSKLELTMNTYSHVMPEVVEGAAEQMGQALWGAPGSQSGAS